MFVEILSAREQDLFFIDIILDNKKFRMFVDTGATNTVVFSDYFKSHNDGDIIHISRIRFTCVDGSAIYIDNCKVYIKNLPYVQIPCKEHDVRCDGIMGVDLLKRVSPILIDYNDSRIYFSY